MDLFVILLGNRKKSSHLNNHIKIGNCNSKFIYFETIKFKDFESAHYFLNSIQFFFIYKYNYSCAVYDNNCDVSDDGYCGSSTRNVFCGEKHKQQEQFKCTAVIGYSIKRYQDVGTESKQEAELALVIPAASASHLNNQNSARGPSLTLTHSMLRAAAAARETTTRWTDLCGATGNTYNYSPPRTRGA